jgi:hypothetical protein
MKRLSVLVVVALLGCQDALSTTEPKRLTIDGAKHSAASVDPSDARLALADAVDRIVPALTDASNARTVGNALRGLKQALDAGRAGDAPALAGIAQAEIERYAKLVAGDAAEVDAIRLALTVVSGTN